MDNPIDHVHDLVHNKTKVKDFVRYAMATEIFREKGHLPSGICR